MTAEAAHHQLVSVEDYLAGEVDAEMRHEFLNGVIYAMAGGTIRHGRISGNIYGLLFNALREKKCQPYNSGTKLRVRQANDTRFYYPDAQVVCHSNPVEYHFQDEPAVIFEVLSESTRRTDHHEKLEAYRLIPSLRVYVLLESDYPAAVVWRRTEQGFAREEYAGLDATLPIPEVEVQLPLQELYEGALNL